MHITGISSMATRGLLSELAQAYQAHSGTRVAIEAVGGVDAAKRVAAGEAFDVAVLAADALAKLAAAAAVLPSSVTPLVNSSVAIAVREGAAAPDIDSEAALRQAVLSARSIGYSTGPSGVALMALFARWGISDALATRLVQAPPGVPVGSLLAGGEVELAFQQLSELMFVKGIHVIGGMPAPVQIDTIFSGAVCASAAQPQEAQRFLAFMASPLCAQAIRRQGMTPAADIPPSGASQ
jgi:molybdate transport system substrate-binding protein